MIPGLSISKVDTGLASHMAKLNTKTLPQIPNVRNAIELALIPWLFREISWNIQKGLENDGAAGEWQHQIAAKCVLIFESIANDPVAGFHVPDSYNRRINRCMDIVITPFYERFATGVFTIKTMLDLLVEDGCLDPIPAESDFERAFIALTNLMVSTQDDRNKVNSEKMWKSAERNAKRIILTLRAKENIWRLPSGKTSVCEKGQARA